MTQVMVEMETRAASAWKAALLAFQRVVEAADGGRMELVPFILGEVEAHMMELARTQRTALAFATAGDTKRMERVA